MPLQTDLDVAPYFDDFDANNQYYRVLFRPSVAVQARELTQVQSILQNQIENFGNWAFKNGDIVSGCSITDDPILPFVRLSDRDTSNNAYQINTFGNLVAVSLTSNLSATILYANSGQVSNYPNTNILYLNYKGSTNSTSNTAKVFGNNETINIIVPSNGYVVATINTFANTTAGQNTTGTAHGIHVDAGIAYLNGTFVNVLTPTYGIVNAYGTYAANNVVGFKVIESIVTENQDPSLLDNSLGYPNQNAPGAYRLKIEPTLVAIDPETGNTDNFNAIASYNYGVLIKSTGSVANLYSIVGDAIASRIYDEAGNYVVNPFIVDTVTSITGSSIISAPTGNTMIGRVNPGRGYAQGYPVGFDITQYINPLRRGVDTQTNLEQQITFGYGGYFILDEVAGDFDFTKAQTIQLYDTPQMAVTNRYFSALTPIGNQIGTALARCFVYNGGLVGSNSATYLLHVFNVNMNANKNVNQVQSVYYSSGSTHGVGDLYKTGLQSTTSIDQLYTFGVPGLMNLRDSSNNLHTEYTYRNKISGTMNTSGALTYTITSSQPGGTDILPYGVGQLADSIASSFTLVATANVDSSALSGTVSISSACTTVTGSGGTSFNTQFNPYDTIKVTNSTASTIRTVLSVSGASSMVVDAPFNTTESGDTYYKTYRAGKIIPIQYNVTGPKSYIQVTNSTSFTINTAEIPSSSLAVDVIFDVLRTTTQPAQKQINKNRFVKINVDTNPAGPKGPWCLGFSDIHQVKAVYGALDGSYSINNTDYTKLFTYDTGQKDTHYDYGYLYPNAGFDHTIANTLLVELDYFTTNTNSGVGFYTVESYPINDGLPGTVTIVAGSTTVTGTGTSFSSTFNTNDSIQVGDEYKTISAITNSTSLTVTSAFISSYNADTYYKYNTTIQTKDMPLYIDSNGNKNALRDYVDFRTPSVPTASDTGNVDISNTSSVTASISAATVNPSSTLTLSIPSAGLNFPSYGKNLQSDYTFYLGRHDLIFITPDNVLKVKEGVSSLSPQDPLYPDNGMALAVLSIPPFPSLTTDQLDELLPVNQLSKNLIRDTSSSVSSKAVTNRRYTMKDIGTIDNRVTNLEYYVALSTLEQQTTSMTVTDSNGLNRFKNGIFADPLNDFTLSDVSNPEFSIAIDQKNGVARPKITREVINISFANSSITQFNSLSSSNVQQTGRVITLPYTEKAFLVQPYSSKYRSAAHVSLAWNGTIILCPAYDNHQDINNTGSINITVDTATPWQEFANSPLGCIWGDWQTTQTTSVDVVTQGTVNNITLDLGNMGNFYGGGGGDNAITRGEAEAYALAQLQAAYPNVTFGNISYNLTHISDIRLKKDISLIGKLINGLNLYKYRYLWSNVFYVGVMAQEVLNIIPDAVVYGSDGFMKVNYAKVGVPFLTWDNWLNNNQNIA